MEGGRLGLNEPLYFLSHSLWYMCACVTRVLKLSKSQGASGYVDDVSNTGWSQKGKKRLEISQDEKRCHIFRELRRRCQLENIQELVSMWCKQKHQIYILSPASCMLFSGIIPHLNVTDTSDQNSLLLHSIYMYMRSKLQKSPCLKTALFSIYKALIFYKVEFMSKRPICSFMHKVRGPFTASCCFNCTEKTMWYLHFYLYLKQMNQRPHRPFFIPLGKGKHVIFVSG